MKSEKQDITFVPVILGSDLNAYGVARSFYEAYGITSILICKRLLGPCRHTRFLRQVIVDPAIEEDEVFIKTLTDLLQTPDAQNADVLLPVPCGDSYSELLSRAVGVLDKKYRYNTVDYKLHKSLNRKESFYKLCDKLGIDHPKTDVVTKKTYKTYKPKVSFPTIIKPTNSILYWQTTFPGKRKVFLARDEHEYKAILNAIYNSMYDDDLILQEFIPGDNEGEMHLYSNQHGKAQFGQFNEIVIGSPTPDGIGSHDVEVAAHNPKIAKQLAGLVDSVGYKGFSNFDMKFDPRDKKWKVFEINIRPGRCSYALTASGHNIAKTIVDDLVYDKKGPLELSEDEVLYSLIPDKIMLQYAAEHTRSKVKRLLAEGKIVHHYLPKADATPMRILDYLRNQRAYYGKYKKYFGRSMFMDEAELQPQ